MAMSRPGFYFLACPDSELLKERINALISEHAQDMGPKPARRVFWADDKVGETALTPTFWQELTQQSLMAEPRVLVVRRANLLLTKDWDDLSPALARFNDQAWPLFCLEGEFDKRGPKVPKALSKQKFWTFAQKKGWLWQSPGLDPKAVRGHVQAWAKKTGATFAPGALEILLAVLPSQATPLARELEKLELAYAGKGAIGPEAAELVAHVPDMNIFSFIDALQQGTAPVAVWRQILVSHASGQAMLFPFLGMLLREARILWQLCYSDPTLRLPGFIKNKKQPLARRLGPERISRLFELALEAELGVKSGERKPDQAMELLVAGLVETFSSFRPGAGGPRGR